MTRASAPPVVQCLSFHAEYACRNTGVCCGSGWTIAVESSVQQTLRLRLKEPGLELPNGPGGFVPLAGAPAGCDSALRLRGRVCWFRDDRVGRCAIHRSLGESALPSACRHFPRVCVLERDRVALSLSHYCPTAAALLFADDGGFSVVTAPSAFPRDWPFEGLDVRDDFPPLLRPGVLLGFDGLRALELATVRSLAMAIDARVGLDSIEHALVALSEWTPEGPSVPALVDLAFARATSSFQATPTAPRDPRPVLLASLTHGTEPPSLPEWNPSFLFGSADPAIDRALRRYLAARAFGNWILFHGADVRILGRYLRLALDAAHLFAGRRDGSESASTRWLEAIRSADLWLMHHCDPDLLARNLR